MPVVVTSPLQVAQASRLPLPLLYWHLLSLDAPTVACVWACLLAYAADTRPSLSATLVLGLGTWSVYVADRLLDAFHEIDPRLLRERHRFARRHCLRFLVAGFIVGVALVWLISRQMSERARTEDAVIFVAALIYFAAVHGSHAGLPRWLSSRVPNRLVPKELAVALLFAAATSVPALSQAPSRAAQVLSLAGATLIFCGVCWLNCMAIEHWETNGLKQNPSPFKLGRQAGQAFSSRKSLLSRSWTHHTHSDFALDDKDTAATWTPWHWKRLGTLAGALAGAAFIVTPILLIVPEYRPVAPVLLCAAVSALLIYTLDRRARRMGGTQLRIAADLALLTPVALLPLLQ